MPIVLQFYPNGEFSQGVDTSGYRPPKHVCKPMQTSLTRRTYTIADIERAGRLNAEIPPQTYNVVGYEFISSIGVHFILRETTQAHCVLQRVGDVSEYNSLHISITVPRLVFLGFLSPLVHQSVESCEKPKSRKKLTSMSKRMSRNIRNAVYLLERQPGGKDVLSFLTLTLPALSTEGLASCCKNWDSMVKRFFDWLRVKCRNAGMDLQHVYCTEIQTKRLTNRGEYAPHLHVVYRGRKSKKAPWLISPKQARREWSRCICAYVDEKFDTSALENLQRIKYSAARYLSKYMSKGCQSIPDTEEENAINKLATQWGGMARTLSQGIRKNIQRFVGTGSGGHIAFSIMDNMDKLIENGFVRYFKRGFISTGIDNSTGLEYGLYVGCGCLQTPTYELGLIPIMDYISAIAS